MLVRFEKAADVHGLTAPYVSVDRPVEGELQRATVELAERIVRRVWARYRACSLRTGSEVWRPL